MGADAEEIRIGLGPMTIAELVAVAGGARVAVEDDALAAVQRTRVLLDDLIASGEPVYGLTTGVGDQFTVGREATDAADAQLGTLRSHASGIGAPHDERAVRAIMTVTLKSLAQGMSGIGVRLVRTIEAMLNRGVTPWAPSQGSVGYLTSTAHIGLVVFGHGRAWYGGELLPGGEALQRAGIEVTDPGPREGNALISGTYEISGIGALAVHDTANLVRIADAAGALSLEVLRGNARGFDDRVQRARPHPGQIATAAHLRALLEGSEILAANAGHRLQDALSLRSLPQVHGAVRDALSYVERVVEVEINSVTDNPVLVVEDGVLAALPNGNGHGAPLALALDALAIAIAELTTMSQARSDRLTSRHLSGLPAFLVPDGSAASGLMIPPYVAAAISAENRALAAPASVHTVSTGAGQEDHVSMGTAAAVKARTAAANAAGVLAVEILCGAQAAAFHAPLRPGRGTGAMLDAVAARVPFRTEDRDMAPDLDAVRTLVLDGTLNRAIEGAQ